MDLESTYIKRFSYDAAKLLLKADGFPWHTFLLIWINFNPNMNK